MSHIEKEFKWAVQNIADFETFLTALRRVVKEPLAEQQLLITDSYLDNPSAALSAQKVALRIRQVGDCFEATMKTRSQLQQGLARRKELSLPLSSAVDLPTALEQLQSIKTWEGIGLENLAVKFQIKNCRRAYAFTYEDALCEAALDEYQILAGGKTLLCREIELELKSGAEQTLQTLIDILTQRSGLAPAKISKVATAEKLLHS
ncbi:MAG: CYTH domain-containing protein [Elusimicrobiaceae bacterium]|nr:CYTH domain-containing protein [Elusimicrobiaceae bacterium]